MGVSEHASGTSSGWRYDNPENDRIILSIYGPKGATKFCGVLSTIDARNLRDQLDMALNKIVDARARTTVYVVVENAGYEGERDAQQCASYGDAIEWMTSKYSPKEIEEKRMAICRDIAGERSYDL
ncbi:MULTISPECIES: hypothetical protein [unclassified Bradyrhizobium]|uniref:hypothetical protein n=1 Tax=unclassified Bradyrhizobium TaxID=2631580 RepID=UPI0028E5E3CD|nr:MULTISPECIES: hypothetical protein [unclassified Bradyrhizobium]